MLLFGEWSQKQPLPNTPTQHQQRKGTGGEPRSLTRTLVWAESSDDHEAMKQIITQDIYYKCHEQSHKGKLVQKTENKRVSEKTRKAGALILHLKHRKMPSSWRSRINYILKIVLVHCIFRKGKHPQPPEKVPATLNSLCDYSTWPPVCYQQRIESNETLRVVGHRHPGARWCTRWPRSILLSQLKRANCISRKAASIFLDSFLVPAETCDKITVKLRSDSFGIKIKLNITGFLQKHIN